jgi:pilus assembly protein FimV
MALFVKHSDLSVNWVVPLLKKSALVIAIMALLSAHVTALALAFGGARVISGLGQPLIAEVETPAISSDEAATFQASLGSPLDFQAAGLDFSPALIGTRVTLHRRSNGAAYLRVQGLHAINEPILSIVINASWSKSHLVRDYTLLIK